VNLEIEMVWSAENLLVMEAITIFGIEPVNHDLNPDEERVLPTCAWEVASIRRC
jgi:hypothetical protein